MDSPQYLLEKQLEDSGVEIYESNAQFIRIAERHRVQIMDSLIMVSSKNSGFCVEIRCRISELDFRGIDDARAKTILENASASFLSLGYISQGLSTSTVPDPVGERTLDKIWDMVLHKVCTSPKEVVSEIKAALATERYVKPD